MIGLKEKQERMRLVALVLGILSFVWTLAGIGFWNIVPMQGQAMVLLVFIFLITFFGVALRKHEYLTRRVKNDGSVHN